MHFSVWPNAEDLNTGMALRLAASYGGLVHEIDTDCSK